MNPLTAQQRAHLRMLESLPKRTHHKVYPEKTSGGFKPSLSKAVMDKAIELDATGMPRKQIARIVGISATTITNRLGRRR
jgi:hypothetical protein